MPGSPALPPKPVSARPRTQAPPANDDHCSSEPRSPHRLGLLAWAALLSPPRTVGTLPQIRSIASSKSKNEARTVRASGKTLPRSRHFQLVGSPVFATLSMFACFAVVSSWRKLALAENSLQD